MSSYGFQGADATLHVSVNGKNDIRSPDILDWKQKKHLYMGGVKGTNKDGGAKENKAMCRMDDYYSCSKVPPSQRSHLHPRMGICACGGARGRARACTPAIKCASYLKFDDSTCAVKRPSCPLASQWHLAAAQGCCSHGRHREGEHLEPR